MPIPNSCQNLGSSVLHVCCPEDRSVPFIFRVFGCPLPFDPPLFIINSRFFFTNIVFNGEFYFDSELVVGSHSTPLDSSRLRVDLTPL